MKKNDLIEYSESDKSVFAVWVNQYLTLMFPHGCKELTPKNSVGFQINGMKHILHKAEEQASIPLTPEQEAWIGKLFTESGWANSIDDNGDKIWNKELDWKENGNTSKASACTKQIMDANKGSAIN